MKVVVSVVVFLAGAGLCAFTGLTAIKTVVVPRATPLIVNRIAFVTSRRLFLLLARPSQPFERRDGLLALYAPVTLVLLPGVWVALFIAGFAGMFWSIHPHGIGRALTVSGSSLLTLGFVRDEGVIGTTLSFIEATIGLGLVGLMISYLPSIYASFARREALVGMLEVRAGLPPSPVEMIVRYRRIGGLDKMETDLFPEWERWFVEVEESHCSVPAMVYFRSPQPGRSWITAAGCVLDSAALLQSAVDRQRHPSAALCLRSGFFCLRRIADYFAIPYPSDPAPTDPISVTRAEFDEVYERLAAAGVPMQADRDQAWRDFAGWRVNYDTVLVQLAKLTMAPPAPWSTDRPGPGPAVRVLRRRRTTAASGSSVVTSTGATGTTGRVSRR